jgi:hypothetical protein
MSLRISFTLKKRENGTTGKRHRSSSVRLLLK